MVGSTRCIDFTETICILHFYSVIMLVFIIVVRVVLRIKVGKNIEDNPGFALYMETFVSVRLILES